MRGTDRGARGTGPLPSLRDSATAAAVPTRARHAGEPASSSPAGKPRYPAPVFRKVNRSFFDNPHPAPTLPPMASTSSARLRHTSPAATTSAVVTGRGGGTATSARRPRQQAGGGSTVSTWGATCAARTCPAPASLPSSSLSPPSRALVLTSSSSSSSAVAAATPGRFQASVLQPVARTTTAAADAPPPPPPPRFVPPVVDWWRSARGERESGQRNVDLARALFEHVVRSHPQNVLSVVALSRGALDGSPVEQLTMLATRASVSALLLQETVLSLPRHQQMLEPYVRMLLRAVFVPDDAGGVDVAAALPSGTLFFPPVLEGLDEAAAAHGVASPPSSASPLRPGQSPEASTSLTSRSDGTAGHDQSVNRSAIPSTTGATVPTAARVTRSPLAHGGPGNESRGGGGANAFTRESVFEDDYLAALLASGAAGPLPDQLAHLLAPFARKPFFIALLELSQAVTAMAHTVRTQQLHVQRLPLIFATTHVSWTKTLLRTVMRAWWKLCGERRVQSQRHRARWAKRWSTERLRVGLRRWRGVAAYTLQTAEADSAAKAAVAEKREVIRRYLVDVEGLQKSSRELSEAIEGKVAERKEEERALAEGERSYMAALERVREADRVGTAILDYLLLPLSDRSDDLLDGREFISIAALQSERDLLPLRQTLPCAGSLMQQHHVGSLRVLVEWANQKLLTDGKDTEELCATSPRAAERHLSRRERGKQEESTARGAHPSDAEEEGERSVDAAVAMEAVFTALLPNQPESTASGGHRHSGDEGGGGASSSAGSSSNSSDPDAFVPIPFYKYLVLMRCFKHTFASISASAAAAAARAVLSAGQGVSAQQGVSVVDLDTAMGREKATGASVRGGSAEGGSGHGGGGFEVHPKAPALDTVRMVKTADAAVLESLTSLHQLARRRSNEAAESAAAAAAAAAAAGEALDHNNLVELLPEDMRTTAAGVAKILVDSYERLTGTACVVTARQLLQRRRGVQLVFLAALFRHYANWSVRRAQVEEVILSSHGTGRAAALRAVAAGSLPSTGAAVAGGGSLPRMDNHMGRRHVKYAEWYTPPVSHMQWLARVRNQQAWAALSFSAMHRALYETTRLRSTLSVEEQDRAVSFVRALSLTRLADVLPASPDHTAQFYVGLVRVVEQCFLRLQHVFRLYALPLAEVHAARRAAKAAAVTAPFSPGAAPHALSKPDVESESGSDVGGDGSDGEGEDDDDVDGNGAALPEAVKAARRREKAERAEKTKSDGWEDALHLSANSFWHLLCDARVAGGDASAIATSVTLHRPAVFAILEHVVFRTLDPATAASATGKAAGDYTRSRSSLSSRRPRTGEGARAGKTTGNEETTRRRQTAVPQVGSLRILPHIAHAIQEQRHVDLRHERATLCLTFDQFAEALLRCAHYWQAMQANVGRGSAAGEDAGDELLGISSANNVHNGAGGSVSSSPALSPAPQWASRRSSFTSLAGRQASVPPGSSAASPLASAQSTAQGGGRSRIPSPAMAAATPVRIFADYEGPLTECSPLSPQLLEVFLGDWILPHCLSGPGGSATVKTTHRGAGIGSAPSTLTPFRRAIRQFEVRRLLAVHQEELFRVFTRFSTPREAFGIRRALPPPFRDSASPAPPPTPRPPPSPADGRGSSQQQPFSAAARGGGAEVPSPSTAKLRDVGIVAVMSFAEVSAMAKALRWSPLSPAALHHCFTNVVADKTRERETIFFTEFLDLLCAVASFVEVNPMTPLVVKLERFLGKFVLVDLDQL